MNLSFVILINLWETVSCEFAFTEVVPENLKSSLPTIEEIEADMIFKNWKILVEPRSK